MKLLTPESWSGLPMFQCEYRRGDAGVHLPVSVLLFWPAEGMSIEVAAESGGRSTYQTHPGRFDVLPSGAFVAVTRAERVVHPMVVAIPSFWVTSLVIDQGPAPSLEHPRLQFSDRQLERLVCGLQRHRISNEPLGAHYTQALSTILADRLLMLERGRALDGRDDGILPPMVRRLVQELIDERLDSPPDVASLAALAGQGTLRFLRSFKATLGVTLHQYVMRRRIERAKLLLASAARPLTSVALELGFASHAHFTTAFRTHTGITPSAYRLVRRDGPLRRTPGELARLQ